MLLMAVGRAFCFGLSSSSLDFDRSRLVDTEPGEICGVGAGGDRDRLLGVAGALSSGDLSRMYLSLGSPLFGNTLGGPGGGSRGIGLNGSP